MIFATVGMSDFPFDRLLAALDQLPRSEDRLVIQTGSSAVRPARALCYPFLPFDDVASYMRNADVIVAHAGVGSVLLALRTATPLLVAPRRKDFGEAIDDHQAMFAEHLQEARLARVIDPEDLAEAVTTARSRHRPRGAAAPVQLLAVELAHYLDHRLAATELG